MNWRVNPAPATPTSSCPSFSRSWCGRCSPDESEPVAHGPRLVWRTSTAPASREARATRRRGGRCGVHTPVHGRGARASAAATSEPGFPGVAHPLWATHIPSWGGVADLHRRHADCRRDRHQGEPSEGRSPPRGDSLKSWLLPRAPFSPHYRGSVYFESSPCSSGAWPLAPKPGTPVVVRSGLDAHIVPAPPPGPVFQMIPWKESETYTFPALSNVSAFKPADPVTVMKTEEVAVNGSTRRTLALPKSITRSSWVVGWKSNPRSRLLDPATPKTKSCPGLPPWVTSNVVT